LALKTEPLAQFVWPINTPPVGSRGDSYDNALAETINGLYKAELNHRRGLYLNQLASTKIGRFIVRKCK
jgi:hypothetical protein